MAAVGNQRAIGHRRHVVAADGVAAAGNGDKDLANLRRFQAGHYGETVHHGFEGADGVDFGNDDMSAEAAGPGGHAAAAPAIAADYHFAASPKDVSGPGDAVQSALPGAIAVVKEMLGFSFVDGNDRVAERAVRSHGVQADDAGGSFLSAAQHRGQQFGAAAMEHTHQVSAVVHGVLGLAVQHGTEVLVVGFVVLALDGVGRDAVLADQGGGYFVLGAEGIAGAEGQVSAAVPEGNRQVGGFSGYMEAGSHTQPLQRLFPGKAFPDNAENAHLPLGPLDTIYSVFSQGQVPDIALGTLNSQKVTP